MNIVVAQSGGPTCAINASLLGVFKGAMKSRDIDIVFGSLNGIEGIINDDMIILNDYIRTYMDMEQLRQTPSTLLNSCRYKLPDMSDDKTVYEKIYNTLKNHGIGAFFYIGGNDSMDTVNKISAYLNELGSDIKVIGIPKTIDNDLTCTDHTPGYGSAAKYVATTVQEIVRDCSVYSINSVTIIEIMGRDTGWLTAATAVLRANGEIAPHLIYLPEARFSVQSFLSDIRRVQQSRRAVVIAVSEGIELDPNDIPSEIKNETSDNFGHRYLSGVGKCLENIVRREIKCKVRSIELNIMQRCSSHISSKTDIEEAEQIGTAAVDAALSGLTGKVMVFERVSDNPYTVVINSAEAADVANRVRYFPPEWINAQGNNVTDKAVKYILPLIQGSQDIHYRNGIPMHFRIGN
ncbi:MAG: 6-phosphofructokinase [Clostridia bacterium]|nr:6-phosphofructokinase [Clostridia bacterium]